MKRALGLLLCVLPISFLWLVLGYFAWQKQSLWMFLGVSLAMSVLIVLTSIGEVLLEEAAREAKDRPR